MRNAMVLLALASAAVAAEPPAAETATQPAKKVVKRTVFAVPFENATGKDQYEPVACGMGDLMAVLLGEQEHIAVVERQRLEALTEEQARSLKGLTGTKYAVAAGKLLAADTVLTGRVFLVNDKLTVNVKALDLATERVLASEEVTTRPEEFMEACLRLARGLGKGMSLPLPEIDLRKIDKSPYAALHFAKALACYYAGNMDEAIMHLMQTIDLDPNYVEASYWAGMCYSRQKEWAHAVIELEKFLKDAPDSPYAQSAHNLLAEAKKADAGSAVPRLEPTAAATPTSAPTTAPAPK